MRLADWLALIEQRHPQGMVLGLERVRAVAERLALPRPARQVVAVAGTNGKGSCARLLEVLALAAGRRVGCYTSPHLLRYNERVRLGGRPVDDETLCAAFDRVEAARGDVLLTYFEVGTLAALHLFAAADLDLAVLEVGMGGRLDAVNLVDADLAVITPIAIDHARWLGPTREAIALEKAGIARAGRPVVVADPDPPATLAPHLDSLGARPLWWGRDFEGVSDGEGFHLRLADGRRWQGLPAPRLPPTSVAAAVQGAALLDALPGDGELAAAVGRTALAGRYQRLTWAGRTVVLDVAHNPAAAAHLAARLAGEGRPVHAVAAIMADKDVAGFCAALAGTVSRWFAGDLPGVARALPAERFAAQVAAAGGACTVHGTVAEAFAAGLTATPPGGTLAVCGSFLTVGAVMAHLGLGDGF
ncbi:MAG: bifunctional folylpolyglutamate synthase/dihydrofolate synthase [Porticoccaceae bacterium]|nr:MAG: bifunctional folylpolyglutamate synthase/dihydrofolate synthase [Porticoccaceae bacterium]